MKLLLLAGIALPLFAQQAATEDWLTGYIELGYRARTDVGGSFSTYRSIVDLGSGPKLLGADFTILDPKHRYFDRVNVRAFDWGGDPYSTLHIDVRKSALYRFDADYRSLAYYDNLPSFADPQLASGIQLNEQSFDTRRHIGSYNLELFPANTLNPYLSFERDTGSGHGVSSFVDSFANEFAVPDVTSDRTNLFRGGVRIAWRRMHLTLEQGGTTYGESQNTYVAPGNQDPGDTSATYLGQPLYLSSLLQAYGIHGSSTYTKSLLSASPYSWLDLSGEFLFSQSGNHVSYFQNDTGSFAELAQALLVTSEQYLIASAAKLPHTTGNFGAQLRPFKRVRILESWMTDRLHNAGNSSANAASTLLAGTLASNYNQQDSEIFFDANSRFLLRAGYRAVWGDGDTLVLPAAGLFTTAHAALRSNTALAGLAYRRGSKLSTHADFEGARSTGAYFRTSLYNYAKARAQARYQLFPTLNLSADFTFLNNANPLAGANYHYGIRREALSMQWLPTRIKAFSFQGTYERSALHSDISYLIPQTLASAASLYRENAHTVTGLVSAKLPFAKGPLSKATISAGGSAFLSSGSRATTDYQPVAKLTLPVGIHVSGFAEWKYDGFGESYYLYESFRTHLFTVGLRYTR
jgi:hypothetical protein